MKVHIHFFLVFQCLRATYYCITSGAIRQPFHKKDFNYLGIAHDVYRHWEL